jgi:phosphate transport system ATP-binding protein
VNVSPVATAMHPRIPDDHDHLVFRGWTVRRGSRELLSGIDLAVPRGRIVALVGPSGAGKSCLLSSVNRLLARDREVVVSGDAILGGRPLWGVGVDDLSMRRRSGTVFREPDALPGTVRDNVLLPFDLDGIRHGSRREDALEQALREALLWDELRDRTMSPAASFPAGIRARIQLARALAGKPEILLLDEPCAFLDPAATELFEQAILGLAGRCTVVVATHNLAQASRVSQRLAFLWEGRIEEYGPTHRVFQRPIRAITEDYLSGRAIA